MADRSSSSSSSLRKFVGLVKDHVAVARAVAQSGFSHLDLALVRATSHGEALPEEEAVKCVLDAGSGSRMRVAHCINVLMKRLSKTHDWAVALKSLILVHRCLHEGGFMFQDQLSFYPARGGRNYLNLSKFKDATTAFTWAVSDWIRWYARFLEQWILTSRVLGTFLDARIGDTTSSPEKFLSLPTGHLVREIMALHDLLQEACGWQAEGTVIGNSVVKEGLKLVVLNTVKALEEVKLRMREVPERITTLQGSEALQLLQVCEKLSAESTILTHLLEIGQDLHVLQTSEISGTAFFTDYELMELKEALRPASTGNVSAPLVLAFPATTSKKSFGFGHRAEGDNTLEERRRERSLSESDFPRTLFKRQLRFPNLHD